MHLGSEFPTNAGLTQLRFRSDSNNDDAADAITFPLPRPADLVRLAHHGD